MFRYKCLSCGEWHEGMPALNFHAPELYFQLNDDERDMRGSLGTDDCVVDETFFFVRGCLEIPVHGVEEPLTWGVWVSLSAESFAAFCKNFHELKRSHVGPFFGWFSNRLPLYADTINLKTSVHLRDDGIRPLIELELSDHPLAIEQRNGISVERAAELLNSLVYHA